MSIQNSSVAKRATYLAVDGSPWNRLQSGPSSREAAVACRAMRPPLRGYDRRNPSGSRGFRRGLNAETASRLTRLAPEPATLRIESVA